jgi:hypothetical protein
MMKIFWEIFPGCTLFVWWLVETESKRARFERTRRRILDAIEAPRA